MSLVILNEHAAKIVSNVVVESLIQRLKVSFEFHLNGGSNRYQEIADLAGELQNIARQLAPEPKKQENDDVQF